MTKVKCVLLFTLAITFNFQCISTASNPLNGKHLRTVWVLWRKDDANVVFGPKGAIFALDYVARRLNFSYTMVENVTETTVERPKGGGRGVVDYLLDGSADLLAHDISATPERYAMMDLTLPWIYGDTSFLIPTPDSSTNVEAVLKPFQWPVWASLIPSVVVVIFSLLLFIKLVSKFVPAERFHSNFDTTHGASNQDHRNVSLYVFGVLMSQSGPCLWWPHSIRLVAAAWCLAAFILVNGYCSTLITYVISHYNPPLIESVHDLARDSTINLIVDKGKAFEFWFSDPKVESPIFVKLREKLANNPKSRCYGADDCLNSVKTRQRNVFVQARVYLFDAIMRDFNQTGKCNFQIAKRQFFSFPVCMGLKKHSPYTSTVSRAVTETFEYGLHGYWQSLIRRVPTKVKDCWKKSENPEITKRSQAESGELNKLTLTNLTGAFVILATGCIASFIAFIVELMADRLFHRL